MIDLIEQNAALTVVHDAIDNSGDDYRTASAVNMYLLSLYKWHYSNRTVVIFYK